MKRKTLQNSGIRENIGKKKKCPSTEIVDRAVGAEKMALLAQNKIEGKKMVPHPTLKKTWVYK